MQTFERYSETYESKVKEKNEEKEQLRNQIFDLEKRLR